jgi:hypothetical protein
MTLILKKIKNMLKIYYKICVDAIEKSKTVNNGIWKFNTIMFMSAFLSLIFMSIIILLKSFFPEYINFTFFHDNYGKKSLDVKLEAIVLYLVPSLIMNYFLIIHNKRYEKLLHNYKPNNGKYMIRFMLFSIILTMVSIFIS